MRSWQNYLTTQILTCCRWVILIILLSEVSTRTIARGDIKQRVAKGSDDEAVRSSQEGEGINDEVADFPWVSPIEGDESSGVEAAYRGRDSLQRTGENICPNSSGSTTGTGYVYPHSAM